MYTVPVQARQKYISRLVCSRSYVVCVTSSVLLISLVHVVFGIAVLSGLLVYIDERVSLQSVEIVVITPYFVF